MEPRRARRKRDREVDECQCQCVTGSDTIGRREMEGNNSVILLRTGRIIEDRIESRTG
jgi:hypothetical protein